MTICFLAAEQRTIIHMALCTSVLGRNEDLLGVVLPVPTKNKACMHASDMPCLLALRVRLFKIIVKI